MKRKYPRVNSINLISTQQVTEDHLQEYGYVGATVNLSEGGVLFESKVPFPLLSTLQISLALKDNVLEVKGRVVRLEERVDGIILVAIHFTDVSPEDKGLLRAYVDEKNKGLGEE